MESRWWTFWGNSFLLRSFKKKKIKGNPAEKKKSAFLSGIKKSLSEKVLIKTNWFYYCSKRYQSYQNVIKTLSKWNQSDIKMM